jgi:signal peptidase II
MEIKKKLAFILPIAAVCAAIDLYTKSLAVKHLRMETKTVIENFFDFNYVENSGMAWGLGKGFSTPVFIGLSLLAFAVLIYFILKVPFRFYLTHLSLALTLGGACGNLYDRLAYGYVVDFISWHYYQHIWPTFNMADVFISVGVALLVLQMILAKEDPFGIERGKDSEEKPPNPLSKL